MYATFFKPIGNLVKTAFLTGTFILSLGSNLWASGPSTLSDAELVIAQKVSNYENFCLNGGKLTLETQRKFYYFSLGLGCDTPIIEALYHVLVPQPITLDEYKVYQNAVHQQLVQKNRTLLNLLHADLRMPMAFLVFQDLSSKELHGSDNEFKVLPRMIRHYNNAENLILLNNQLTQLPPEIGHLSKLQRLDLSHNQLTQLPPEIGQLSQLQVLSLNNNRLAQLPPEISQLNLLHLVCLFDNPILEGLDTSTAAYGYVEGSEPIRAMFRENTIIRFDSNLFISGLIFGTGK